MHRIPIFSARADRFLRDHATVLPRARSLDGLPAPIARFERRFGGLSYRVLGSNPTVYGVEPGTPVHRTPLGPGFPGILDGDATCHLDVLLDGRTAVGFGRWAYRVIDRSVEQRIERHALLVEVRGWFHRSFECRTPPGVLPITDESALPPPVPEASGPAELWWHGAGVAVQATLRAWPPDRDHWTVRYFTRAPFPAADANPAVYTATTHETTPALSCTLCHHPAEPGRTCLWRGQQ